MKWYNESEKRQLKLSNTNNKLGKESGFLETDRLYQVEKKDIKKLEDLLTRCFLNDPLYCKFIPDEKTRKRLLPELFKCDLEELFESCVIYADSKELNGIIVVSDESEHYNVIKYFWDVIVAELKTDHYLIKEDPSLKTLWNFSIGRNYLNSKWTEKLDEDNRLHIIYLAVSPTMQHHGISRKLIQAVLDYAGEYDLMVSLETHNRHNVSFYEHFGFLTYEKIEKHFDLVQYCMIREARSKIEALEISCEKDDKIVNA